LVVFCIIFSYISQHFLLLKTQKTAGFLFPILMAMIKAGGQDPPDDPHRGSRRTTYPEALVLAPTRELAQQIYEEGQRFAYMTGIACVCIYGGADIRDQLRQIESRGCDLLVGTPGRLVDLIERGRIAMANVRFLVLDEADRMLDMGFEVCCFCPCDVCSSIDSSIRPYN
jgi:ATP-dependent RNA helicase DDX3X